MKTKAVARRFTISGLAFTLVCSALVGRAQQMNGDDLSGRDKARIVESALQLAFASPRVKFAIATNLSSENVEFVNASRMAQLGFVLLDGGEMQDLRRSQFVEYVVFRKIVFTDGVATVVLSRVTESHPCFGRDASTERSFSYEFRKDSGEWIGQLVHRPMLRPSLNRTLLMNP